MFDSRRYVVNPWVMVAIFTLLYTFSFLDRTIINMMVAPIEKELHISDFQMGILQGPAFIIFYVVCGVPMGWLVDRLSKRWITFAGVAVWGVATCCCGFASNFMTLMLGRLGVGVGESTMTPAANAMISERFPARRMSTALSFYALGAVIGGGLAVVGGGALVQAVVKSGGVTLPLIGHVRGWQAVFLAVGAMTVLLVPLTLLLNDQADRKVKPGAHLGSIATLIGANPILFLGLPIGFGFTAALSSAYAAWVPTFMVRTYGWNIAQVGLAWGVQHIITGSIGQIASGFVVDRLYARGLKNAHTWYQVVGLAFSVPTMVWAFNCGNPWLFLVLTSVFFCLTYPFVGYAAAALQLFTPTALRGRVASVSLALTTLIGTGLGAMSVGWLTDNLFHDKTKVGLSLSIVTLAAAPLIIGFLLPAGQQMKRMIVVTPSEPVAEPLDV